MSTRDAPPVCLVYGDAEPIVAWELQRRLARWGPLAEPASFNRSSFDASDDRAEEALVDARTPPMMAARRLVVLRGVHEASEALLGAVDAYLESPAPETILVLTGSRFGAARKGGKAWGRRLPQRVADAGGEVVERRADGVRPGAFVVEHARVTLERAVEPAAAEALVALVGDDLNLLARELDKLDVAVPEGQRITQEDVAEFSAAHAPSDLFPVLDAIVAGRPGEALGALARALGERGSPEQVFGLLLWKIRAIVAAQGIIADGGGVQEVRSAVRGRPSDAAAIVAMLRDRPVDPLLLPRVVEAWVALRARRVDPTRQVEALILDLAQGAPRAP